MDRKVVGEATLMDVERAKYLWEAYKYRHDLIWHLTFRITTVAALLSLAPFVVDENVVKKAGVLVILPPVLALLFVIASLFLLRVEFRHFDRIVDLYDRAQNAAVWDLPGLTIPKNVFRKWSPFNFRKRLPLIFGGWSPFNFVVYGYTVVLMLLVGATVIYVLCNLDDFAG